MIINKLPINEQDKFKAIFDEFSKGYPGPDDNPENSSINEIVVSPFDHWLSLEEAESEIRMFSKAPTPAQLEKFQQNELKNLNFLNRYLKSNQFYYLKSLGTERPDGAFDYDRIFYSCSPESNFYDFVNDSMQPQIFLPMIKVHIWLNDDYTIHFHVNKESVQEIANIISLANECGLHINHNGFLS